MNTPRSLFAAFVFALAFSPASPLFAQWTPTSGPLGADVRSTLTTPGRIFAGTSSGVFASTDNGVTWNPVNSGLPDTATVNALTASGGRILAGTTLGMYATTDNGATWTAVTSGLPAGNISCFSRVAGGLYCGANAGVFV